MLEKGGTLFTAKVMEKHSFRTTLVEALKNRALLDSGFEDLPGMGYRPDAAAWAVTALSNDGLDEPFLKDSRTRLAREQFEDGRVSISRENPEAFWVTPLAVLAWGGSREHGRNLSGAVDFLGTSGKHWEKRVDSVYGHDPELRGWSWTEGTHSWIEPTALAIVALRSTGHGGHPRVSEAVEMLLDRQLPEGGWNYGNTSVFGTVLPPLPAPTGLALQALSGVVPDTDVSDSLSYLGSLLGQLQAPLSLGWALLGLSALGGPSGYQERTSRCMREAAGNLWPLHNLSSFTAAVGFVEAWRLPGQPIAMEITRRDFLISALAGSAIVAGGSWIILQKRKMTAETFIARAENYELDLTSIILDGMKELGITREEIKGKRILVKPNLVEVIPGAVHINTHPLVVRGAVESFLHLGAAAVLVGEGPGHVRDTMMVLELSGLGEVLREDSVRFVDLNNDATFSVSNQGGFSKLKSLSLPATVGQADFIVSLAKMKTHHWAGVTLSMKNLFGLMPGIIYGWPKNVLHWAGIGQSILDINTTVRPHFAIVDGIVGMEGDGPIMGTPKHAGVIVMGRNLTAVDATCVRIMGADPGAIDYLFNSGEAWAP